MPKKAKSLLNVSTCMHKMCGFGIHRSFFSQPFISARKHTGKSPIQLHVGRFSSFSSVDSVYYVEAQLSRSATGGQAGLTGFSIQKIVP